MSLSLDLYNIVIHNVHAVINMSYSILPYMMDDHMFGCYHCHEQIDDLQDLVAHCKSQHWQCQFS